MKLLKGVFYGLLFETIIVAILWGATRVEGTAWAALFGLLALPLLGLRFPEKKRYRP